MQNVGQQYGQGVTPSHLGTPYGHTESSSNSSGSTTSSLRQFRKKDVDKQQVNDTNHTTAATESHVARVAPHNHYPPRTNDNYRYPPQFPDYSLSPQVKYSEISDIHQLQEQVSPSIIQKPKGKEYMEMCSVQQSHMKQAYHDHLNGQQSYAPDSNLHGHAPQYPHKDAQVHPLYKPESQYFPKEAPYQQLPPHHQMQKYNVRKYPPPENDFLSRLRRIHPSMARSIISDHQLQESQPAYQPMDQARMYQHQNQRYGNYASPMQANPYPHNYMPSQNYPNYPPSCSYTRNPTQMAPRFPAINPHERSISPRRGYPDAMSMPPMNYAAMPQKISPSYPQYNAPEYAQHYQHRRMPQDYYQQPSRTAQYLPHQMPPQDIPENRVTVSDSIKQYIENWADEETASEMNQVENSRLCKDGIRPREDQPTETVYMINASELQYLENGIPLVTSENGIPLVPTENGQYIIKGGVAIDNSTAMVRIMDKGNQMGQESNGADRVVNLHIMDTLKPDCMLAGKPNEANQRQDESIFEKPKVVIHQNTVIQPSQEGVVKETEHESLKGLNRLGSNLPVIGENELHHDPDPLEKFEETIFKECKKETADKNCSPINVEQMETFEDFKDAVGQTSVICTTRLLEQEKEDSADSKLSMPLIETLPESGSVKLEEESHLSNAEIQSNSVVSKSEDEMVSKTEEEHYVATIQHIGEEEEPIRTETENKDNVDHDDSERKEENERPHMETKEEDLPVPAEEVFVSNCAQLETSLKTEISTDNDATTPDKMDFEDNAGTNKEASKDCVDTTFKEEPKLEDKKEDMIDTSAVSKKPSSEEATPEKPKRSRIFSVDDIINNIGANLNKPKTDQELAERRRTLQTTKEFLKNEIEYSQLFVLKQEENEMKIDLPEEQDDKLEADDDHVAEISASCKEESNNINEVLKEETAEEKNPKESTNTCSNCTKSKDTSDLNGSEVKPILFEATVNDTKDVKVNVKNDKTECNNEKSDNNNEKSPVDTCCESKSDGVLCEKVNDTPDDNEVQYRNAIRIEDNNVLLEIAGELVEINVANVGGKKVITVTPLSESTVVDFNDNYETMEHEDGPDQTKRDLPGRSVDDEVLSLEDVVPETDVIESTSEIIIGMDISLEEEIQLDLEKPPILCTKAAKKCYENDLQIPSITTSEDINDDNKVDSYVNDKVSSSKEQHSLDEKRIDKIDSSKKTHEGTDTTIPGDKRSERDRKTLKELLKVRKLKKAASKEIEEEDFVSFKELVKARNMKKLKLQQLKSSENVSADSTNNHEEVHCPSEKKTEEEEKRTERDTPSKKPTESKKSEHKNKESKPKSHRKPSERKSDDETMEKRKIKEKCNSPDNDKVNITSPDKIVEKPKEKVVKKVTFGSVDYNQPEGYVKNTSFQIRNFKFEDPKLQKPPSCDVVVPGVVKENAKVEQAKKKLSLEEYNKRKRKLSAAQDQTKTVDSESNRLDNATDNCVVKVDKFKLQRPKSLEEVKVKPKDSASPAKRKFSLDICSRPNHFDWEETQSPKTNLNLQEKRDKRLSEFSGLINNNRSKIVIDIHELDAKPTPSDSSQDDVLQIYKEEVDSKLSSLNLQIPRAAKPPNLDTNNLMERFLRNEKISHEEMEKIRKIISYKRLMQQLNKIKLPEAGDPSYEVRSAESESERDLKLHLKKVPAEKRRKRRFRNLYSDSGAESDSELEGESRESGGAYSVVQSGCHAAGVPKLIIKRKTEMPVPVVRLERLDLDLLAAKKTKI